MGTHRPGHVPPSILGADGAERTHPMFPNSTRTSPAVPVRLRLLGRVPPGMAPSASSWQLPGEGVMSPDAGTWDHPGAGRVTHVTRWQKETSPQHIQLPAARGLLMPEMFHKLPSPPKTSSHPFLEPVCPFGHPGSSSNELLGFHTARKVPDIVSYKIRCLLLPALNHSATEIPFLPFFPPKSATLPAVEAT